MKVGGSFGCNGGSTGWGGSVGVAMRRYGLEWGRHGTVVGRRTEVGGVDLRLNLEHGGTRQMWLGRGAFCIGRMGKRQVGRASARRFGGTFSFAVTAAQAGMMWRFGSTPRANFIGRAENKANRFAATTAAPPARPHPMLVPRQSRATPAFSCIFLHFSHFSHDTRDTNCSLLTVELQNSSHNRPPIEISRSALQTIQ